LIASIHASNVTGDVIPIEQIGKICNDKGLIFLVDATQSAGIIPIDMQTDKIDILAFTGHKKLYGPTGIGGLCIANDTLEIEPLMQGGTGSRSEYEFHPDFYPDRLEAGTLNTIGIVGLKAGLRFIIDKGIKTIWDEQLLLTNRFLDGLKNNSKVVVHHGFKSKRQVSVISLNMQGFLPSDLAFALDNQFGLMVRPGLHCTPLAHRAMGTFPQGSVRFSFGCFTTTEEVDYTLNALSILSQGVPIQSKG
jgi:selenocysteine lyase/cysteine desulfurase